MKFNCSVDVDLPLEICVSLWQSFDNLSEWQDGFQGYEHLSGNPGDVGAKTKMIYKIGKRDLELIETILVNDLPYEFSGEYAAKEMVNTMKNTFHKVNDNRTRWDSVIEYSHFSGIIPKIMSVIMPGLFRKQVQKWMDQFKAFAERRAAEGEV